MEGTREEWAERWYAMREETDEARRARQHLIDCLVVGDNDDEDLRAFLEMGVRILPRINFSSVEDARQLGELVGLCRGIIRGKQDEEAQEMARHLTSQPNYEALLRVVHRVMMGPTGQIAAVQTTPGWVRLEPPGGEAELQKLCRLRILNEGNHETEFLITRLGHRVLRQIDIAQRRAKVAPMVEYLTSIQDGARLRKLLGEIAAMHVPTAAFKGHIDEQLGKDLAVLVEKELVTRVEVDHGNELVSATTLGELVLSRLAKG